MAGYETDIHALIEDINGNYGETQHEQLSLPYSRAASTSYQSRSEPLVDPRQMPASSYNQQPLYVAQASRPQDVYFHTTQAEGGLDEYGMFTQFQLEGNIADYT